MITEDFVARGIPVPETGSGYFAKLGLYSDKLAVRWFFKLKNLSEKRKKVVAAEILTMIKASDAEFIANGKLNYDGEELHFYAALHHPSGFYLLNIFTAKSPTVQPMPRRKEDLTDSGWDPPDEYYDAGRPV